MQSRRWWFPLAVALATLTPLSTLAAPPAPIPPSAFPGFIDGCVDRIANPGKAAGAKPGDPKTAAKDLHDQLDAQTSITAQDQFASTSAKSVADKILTPSNVRPGQASPVPSASIVAGAQVMVEIQNKVIGKGAPPVWNVLTQHLPHPNPAVRYWMAKGLIVSVPKMSSADKARAIPEIVKALRVETSGVIRVQLDRVLAGEGKVGTLAGELARVAGTLQNKAPLPGEAETLAQEVEVLADAVKTAGAVAPAEETAAVQAAVDCASFAAQHAARLKFDDENRRKGAPGATTDPRVAKAAAAALEVANAAVRVANTAAKANTYPDFASPDAAVLQFEVDAWTRPGGANSVQAKFPGVKYPARIGSAPAPTGTAATATSPK